MKILKYILFIALGLIAAVLIVALIVPKTFHAGSTISINKPANEVFDYVVLLRNQGNYDNWSKQDPNIDKKIYRNGWHSWLYLRMEKQESWRWKTSYHPDRSRKKRWR